MNDFTMPEPEVVAEPDRPKRGRPRAVEPVPAAPTVPLVEVSISRDFWKENDAGEIIRYRAGTIVSVPFDTALEGIETGALARVKK